MTNLKLIWEATTSDQNLYNNLLNTIIAGGILGSTLMKLLQDANYFINEFGYSIVILCTIGALCLKIIELRHKIRKRNNGS